MKRTHYPVIVIGGGQAGLSISYCLKQERVDHLILERHQLAWAWREQRWDNFCLVTPNWQCKLPGFAYDGNDPDGFMVKHQIVEYIERYAAHFNPPLREGVTVNRVSKQNTGFLLQTSEGEYYADQVVVAVGNYHHPRFPDISQRLPAHIHQIHSANYKSADALPAGEVLVIGSAQSGAQIAEDLHLAGRQVHLCVGSAPRVTRFYRGCDVVAWLEDMGHYRLTVDNHPLGEEARRKTNHYVTGRDGGRDIDLRAFALQGMKLYGRLLDYLDGYLITGDDLAKNLDGADATADKIKDSIDEWIDHQGITAPTEARYQPLWSPPDTPATIDLSRISTIIWAVGFHTDFSWVDVPTFTERGYPQHCRGESVEAGLYFLGLPWLWTWGSGRFEGVGVDAEYITERIRLYEKSKLKDHEHVFILRE
ncbi:MSMEG_0569 family flavin-dependent oxidoreductase [Klebsiella aerogenes]|uniref:MSMEG_0569 family flavin-dependent oxidoreductase n=1 Tax=Klebsiella aerogenes TaxID=548 RepID=UPI000F7DAE9B|nr:MSMEG_0569 family flavin-dependent oxidoreductase [Klebsiella aerogenes]RSV87621.1 MSMEG_0569 family flavin-dependent oxidoreductase [Klebsiella aerogenes]